MNTRLLLSGVAVAALLAGAANAQLIGGHAAGAVTGGVNSTLNTATGVNLGAQQNAMAGLNAQA
ncbi:hypothetical protein, partial [Nitrospirillum viridazoti]